LIPVPGFWSCETWSSLGRSINTVGLIGDFPFPEGCWQGFSSIMMGILTTFPASGLTIWEHLAGKHSEKPIRLSQNPKTLKQLL